MNIAFVSEFFPPYVTGGAEMFLNALAEYLHSRGHKVIVITTEQGQEKGRFRTYKMKSSPFHFSHRYQFHGITLPWMFCNSGLVKRLKEIYTREGIDVVYINNMFHLSFAPVQAAHALGIPAVLDVHDYWPICFSKDMLHREDPYDACSGDQGVAKCSRCVARKLGLSHAAPLLMPGLCSEKRLRKKWLSSHAIKKVIVHSAEGAKELKRHGLDSMAIPYPYLGPRGRHVDAGDGVFRMLFVSRLERVRGAAMLLDIASAMKKSGMEFRIDVIGKGSLMSQLDRKDLCIHAHGFMGEERFGYFRKANAMLALQRYPVPFGINVIEAMAFQVPVIGFGGCGPGHLVEENGAGIVVDMDSGSVVKALEKLIKNRMLVKRVMANDAKNMEKYDKNAIFKRYEDVFGTA